LVTKKGIALTVAIMGGFTAASFLVYFVPTQPQSEVVAPADPETELVFAMDRNQAIVDDFKSAFQMWTNNELSKDELDGRAEAAMEQVNALMVELRRSNPPGEWVQSYVLYIQALENYRLYFEKAREYVNLAPDTDPTRAQVLLDSMSELLTKAQSLTRQSEDAMP
jgi:hypothetical protein